MRAPKKPPFKVGTRLRCVDDKRGTTHMVGNDGRTVLVYGAGLEVIVTEVHQGRRGTGQQLRDSDGPMFYEDTGEPILDETKDGYSVYVVSGQGRIIWPENRKNWRVVK